MAVHGSPETFRAVLNLSKNVAKLSKAHVERVTAPHRSAMLPASFAAGFLRAIAAAASRSISGVSM